MKKYPLTFAVFGAASDIISKRQKSQAYAVGRAIAQAGHSLITGAGNQGIMGAVAKGYMDNNPAHPLLGTTTEAIETFEGALSAKECNKIITQTMNARKAEYYKADVIIILEGGVGTRDEFWQFLTLKKLCLACGSAPGLWFGDIWVLKSTAIGQSIQRDFQIMKNSRTSLNHFDLVDFLDLKTLCGRILVELDKPKCRLNLNQVNMANALMYTFNFKEK